MTVVSVLVYLIYTQIKTAHYILVYNILFIHVYTRYISGLWLTTHRSSERSPNIQKPTQETTLKEDAVGRMDQIWHCTHAPAQTCCMFVGSNRGKRHWPQQNLLKRNNICSTVLSKLKEKQSFEGLTFLFIVNRTRSHKKTENLIGNWWFVWLGELSLGIAPSRKGSSLAGRQWISCQSWIVNFGDDHSWCFFRDSYW